MNELETQIGFKRILVVEDDPIYGKILFRLLQRCDAWVELAPTFEQAKRMISKDSWDLVLTDVQMPGGSGIDILKASKRKNPNVPVVVLTGDGEMSTAVDALREQADDFLVKPLSGQEVMECVNKQLSRERENRRRVLAIGAHPDDVEIGCGGTLINHVKNGDEVVVITLTGGEHGGETKTRRSESEAAARVMGASLEMFSLPDTSLSEGLETIRAIESVIGDFKPDIAYIHTDSDVHQDHRASHRAAVVAMRSVENVFCYLSPSTTIDFRPTKFVDIGESLEQKQTAISVFGSQKSIRPYLTDDMIRSTAVYWGRFAGYKTVEPYEVVRSSTL